MPKRETVEEFVARGGVITRCPAQAIPEWSETKAMPTTVGSSALMTLSEGRLFYSERKPKVSKKKPALPINVAALPASLLKYVKKEE